MLALAPNAGTPLMFTAFFHLVVGNAVIGVVEAIVLRFAFRVPLMRGVLWMVAANYVSMAFGVLLLSWLREVLLGSDDVIAPGSVLAWLAGSLIGLWAITVFVEWPFVRGAFGKIGGWRRALPASLVAQTISYAMLVPIYLNVAPISAVTQTTAVPTAALAPGLAAHIYYLDEEATAVWCVALDGGAPIRVAEVKGGDCNSEIVVSPSWGEVRITQRGVTTDPVNDRLLPRISLEGRRVATTSDSGWVVDMGNWASEGLFATHRPTGQHLWLALDTPFLAWASREATLLPGDIVVYALGPHIVALELATLRLAVLAQGRSPVVALDAR